MLAATMLVMAAAWGAQHGFRREHTAVDGAPIRRGDDHASAGKRESWRSSLEIRRKRERIRNLAQNELGMLRRERANRNDLLRRRIKRRGRTAASRPDTHMEILDFLLGLLNVFHIGE